PQAIRTGRTLVPARARSQHSHRQDSFSFGQDLCRQGRPRRCLRRNRLRCCPKSTATRVPSVARRNAPPMKIGEITDVDRRANSDQTTHLSPGFWFLLAALAATGAKLIIAWNIIGTNDTVVFLLFFSDMIFHIVDLTY